MRMPDSCTAPLTVATFYQFTDLSDLPELRLSLSDFGLQHALRGTILLAPEGINATVAGSGQAIAQLRTWLDVDGRFAALNWKQSLTERMPFRRYRVRIKAEIVTFGVPGLKPARVTGTKAGPQQWHALLDDPQTLVIDTRNRYEVALGTFPEAHNPDTRSFSQFAQFVERELAGDKQRRIAMFCTGGIRCEKASSFLIERGFGEVFQLDGGILSYLAQVPSEQSRWRGECVVFDERVAVDQRQQAGTHRWCAGCGDPIPTASGQDRCARCLVAAAA
jgi:UPF0176 protein